MVGRRLSFGSDRESGAAFTAVMYSVVRTLALNGIDVRRWLEAWFGGCAAMAVKRAGSLRVVALVDGESRKLALSMAP